MKKVFFALFAVALITSMCFAQQASVPVNQTISIPAETKTFTGKVSSVSLSGSKMSFGSFGKKGDTDGSKKEKPKGKKPGNITLVDEKGEEQSFKVKTESLITTKDGKTLKLDQIKRGDKVEVVYITNAKKGVQEAVAIKLVKSRSILLKIKECVGTVAIR